MDVLEDVRGKAGATQPLNPQAVLAQLEEKKRRQQQARDDEATSPHLGWLLLVLLVVTCAGVFCFSDGFMRTRVALEDVSSAHHGLGRAGGAPRGRVVVLLVDALRYDFAAWPGVVGKDGELAPWAGRLGVLEEEAGMGRGRLFKFVADAPTTTMQRLKALMTGGLPTFIEFGSNFDAAALVEDSLVGQWHRHERDVVFMGDDTWAALWPGQLAVNYTFPSFHVWDLHTVDDGIMEHLEPTLLGERGEWDIVVAHFLGVDHAGHTYGPSHPRMTAKLEQMDEVIRAVMEAIPEDTTLLVMGDHGMLPDGGHGGASDAERTAALYVWRKDGLSGGSLGEGEEGHEAEPVWVHQVDVVPTLAMITQVPIPFSSVGVVIPELLCAGVGEAVCERERFLADALQSNAEQVFRYMERYGEATGQRFAGAAAAYEAAVEDGTEDGYRAFLEVVARDARLLWTTLEMPQMTAGVLLQGLGCACLLGAAVAASTGPLSRMNVAYYGVRGASLGLLLVYGAVQTRVLPRSDPRVWLVGGCATAGGMGLGALWELVRGRVDAPSGFWPAWQRRWTAWSAYGCLGLLWIAVHAYSLFSNSMIEASRDVTHFLLVSSYIATWAWGLATGRIRGKTKSGKVRKGRPVLRWHLLCACLVGLAVVVRRTAVCPAAHVSCRGDPWELPMHWTPVVPLALSAGYRTWQRAQGGCFGASAVVTLVVPITGLLVSLQWMADASGFWKIPWVAALPEWVHAQYALSRAVFLLSGATGLYVAAAPVFIHLEARETAVARTSATPQLFLFGAASSLQALGGACFALAMHPVMVVLGPRSAWMVATAALGVLLSAHMARRVLAVRASELPALADAFTDSSGKRRKRFAVRPRPGGMPQRDTRGRPVVGERVRTPEEAAERVEQASAALAGSPLRVWRWIHVAVIWSLSSMACFHASGQSFEFATVRFDAAFALSQDYDARLVSALLVLLATAAGPLLWVLAIPVVVGEATGGSRGLLWRADFLGGRVFQRLRFFLLVFLLWWAVGALATMLFVRVEHQHLMVYRVFAPKFVYDSALAVVTTLLVLMVWALARRMRSASRVYIGATHLLDDLLDPAADDDPPLSGAAEEQALDHDEDGAGVGVGNRPKQA